MLQSLVLVERIFDILCVELLGIGPEALFCCPQRGHKGPRGPFDTKLLDSLLGQEGGGEGWKD